MYITQIIYLKDGQENIFNQFEDIAIPIIAKYNGQLLLRIRPTKKELIDGCMELPYEVHLIEFSNDSDFADFMKDESRKQFLHLKDQSIKSVLLIKGIN